MGIIVESSLNVNAQQPSIPAWIKSTARWWADGQVSDAEFIKAMQWLINNGILQVPQSGQSQQSNQLQPTASTINELSVTVNGLQYTAYKKFVGEVNDSQGMPFVKGGTYIRIMLAIKNVNNNPQQIAADTGGFILKDSNGHYYFPITSDTGNYPDTNTIQAGVTEDDYVVFLVPAGTQSNYKLLLGGNSIDIGIVRT